MGLRETLLAHWADARDLRRDAASERRAWVQRWYAPDAVYEFTGLSGMTLIDFGSEARGIDAIAEFWRTWLDSWAALDFTVVEVREHRDRAGAWLDQRMRGRTVDIEVEWHYAWVVTVRGGRIVHVLLDDDRERAFALVQG